MSPRNQHPSYTDQAFISPDQLTN